MAWYMGECLPACFCLLGGKKESTYRRMLFPQPGLIGCFFHFGQCLFRNFCDFGLKACYSKDEEFKKWFNLCIAFAFVPPNKVEEIYAKCILDKAPISQYPQLEDFCYYMTLTWADTCAKFPVISLII